MDFTWEEVLQLKEKAGLTGRELAAARHHLGLSRDPQGVYLIHNPTQRQRLVAKAMRKLRKAREEQD